MAVGGEDQSLVHPSPVTLPADWRKCGLELGSAASETIVLWSGLSVRRSFQSLWEPQLQWPTTPPPTIHPVTSAFCQTPAESPGSFTQTDFWASSLTYRLGSG